MAAMRHAKREKSLDLDQRARAGFLERLREMPWQDAGALEAHPLKATACVALS